MANRKIREKGKGEGDERKEKDFGLPIDIYLLVVIFKGTWHQEGRKREKRKRREPAHSAATATLARLVRSMQSNL